MLARVARIAKGYLPKNSARPIKTNENNKINQKSQLTERLNYIFPNFRKKYGEGGMLCL